MPSCSLTLLSLRAEVGKPWPKSLRLALRNLQINGGQESELIDKRDHFLGASRFLFPRQPLAAFHIRLPSKDSRWVRKSQHVSAILHLPCLSPSPFRFEMRCPPTDRQNLHTQRCHRRPRSRNQPPRPPAPKSPRSVPLIYAYPPHRRKKAREIMPDTNLWIVELTALLRVQGREVEAGRVHVVLERRGPGQGLPADDRPISGVYEGFWLRGLTWSSLWPRLYKRRTGYDVCVLYGRTDPRT